MVQGINYDFLAKIALMENNDEVDKIHTDYGYGYESINCGRFSAIYFQGQPVWGVSKFEKEWDLQHDNGLPKEFNDLANKLYAGKDKLIEKGYWTHGDLAYLMQFSKPSPLGERSLKAMNQMNVVLKDYINKFF